jgi:hypothetical protein
MTGDGTYSYSYDGAGRLVSVVGPNSGTYAYGSSAERLKKTQSGVTTHYVWEGSQVIAEYNGTTGALISEYIHAGGRMIARDQGGVLRYFHQDRLSTRLITDGSGAVAGTWITCRSVRTRRLARERRRSIGSLLTRGTVSQARTMR